MILHFSQIFFTEGLTFTVYFHLSSCLSRICREARDRGAAESGNRTYGQAGQTRSCPPEKPVRVYRESDATGNAKPSAPAETPRSSPPSNSLSIAAHAAHTLWKRAFRAKERRGRFGSRTHDACSRVYASLCRRAARSAAISLSFSR